MRVVPFIAAALVLGAASTATADARDTPDGGMSFIPSNPLQLNVRTMEVPDAFTEQGKAPDALLYSFLLEYEIQHMPYGPQAPADIAALVFTKIGRAHV